MEQLRVLTVRNPRYAAYVLTRVLSNVLAYI